MRSPRVSPVALHVVAAAIAVTASTRLSSYGSNPYLSWSLFPQDLILLHANFISFVPSYEKLPYWGDIDDPSAKPNGTYTSTGIDVAAPDGARFAHSGKIHAIGSSLAYTHQFGSGHMGNVAVDYDVDDRTNSAEGTFIADGGAAIPFDYSLTHALNRLHVQGVLGLDLRGTPLGLRFRGGFENSLALDHSFQFEKGGTPYSTDRTTWGWSTSPCAHIFGATGVEGDAWLQNGYAQGPVYDLDILAGVTLPRLKLGALFAYRTGHQDYYSWQPDTVSSTGDQAIDDNFLGAYEKDNWSRTTSGAQVRLFGNVVLRKSERYSLNTFVLLGYEGLTLGRALSSNLTVAGDAQDRTRSLAVEAAPNIAIPFGSIFSYVDVAIPVSYGYSRFDNTYMRWVGGGQTETYRDSRTSADDENSWEGYSYADRNVLDFGLDLNTMFPLINNGVRGLGLGVQLLINSRYTFMTKYYGQGIVQGTEVDFRVDNRREDYEREIQFATGLKLQYRGGPFMAWFEVTEPLLHSLLPRTRVTDASGGNVLYEHEKSPLWLSQQGLRVGMFLAYSPGGVSGPR